MSYRHIFDPVSAKEYEDAFKWYEEKVFLLTFYSCRRKFDLCHLLKSLPVPEYVLKFKRDHNKKISF
jgi:hypothetical protein